MKTKLLFFTLLFASLAATAQDRKGSFEISGGYGHNFATIGGQTLPHSQEYLFKNFSNGLIENKATTPNYNLLKGSFWSVDLAYYIKPKTAIVFGYTIPSTNRFTQNINDSIIAWYKTIGQYATIGLKHNYYNKNNLIAFLGGGINIGFFKHFGSVFNTVNDSLSLLGIQREFSGNLLAPGFLVEKYSYKGGVYLGLNLYTGIEYKLTQRFSIYADIYGVNLSGRPREFDYRSVYFTGVNSNTPGISDNVKRPQINMNFISARAGLRVHFYKKGS